MTVADSYSVIAVAAPGRGPRSRTALAAMSRRVRAESIERCGAEILMRLSNDGGTILVPDSEVTDVDVRVLWCSIAQRSLIAATVPATSSEIPVAAGQAHELLDLALALGRTSGLYRFDDLALEYQLTRPGLGRERLAAVLDPLVPHPHLWQTLELFLISNLSRRALARRLGLHTNTIEYRLKRVAALTGLDPLTPTGQWHLRSALVARIRVNRHNR
ncbi:PucR family transcriptional regulator [Nocardia wallacei]|uniref:PucR family transcriptional regulator n=1 Tax=Nocardia wallacei TaxID=480035 RepID=UPI002457E87E|nr:helix-turn-helix domain-containing protein [Nocardia wallacei]